VTLHTGLYPQNPEALTLLKPETLTLLKSETLNLQRRVSGVLPAGRRRLLTTRDRVCPGATLFFVFITLKRRVE